MIGVGIGAVIHNWIPEGWVSTALGSNNPFGVILATLIGVPMYADIFGTIPVAEALFAKGAQLGVILSFMRATIAFAAFNDYVAKGYKAQTAGSVYCYLYNWNHNYRLFVQCFSGTDSLGGNKTWKTLTGLAKRRTISRGILLLSRVRNGIRKEDYC